MGIEFSLRRFHFSLESVLTVRENALKDARIELAKIIDNFNKHNDKLNEMLAQSDDLKKNSEEYLNEGGFNPDIIANFSSYAIQLNQSIEFRKNLTEKFKTDIRRQQKVVKEAYIKVKSLEKLKEKQKQEYEKEVFAREIKETDDIVNSRRITA